MKNQSHKTICKVGPDSQFMFQIIPNVLDGVEVRTGFKLVKFFYRREHTGHSPNCCSNFPKRHCLLKYYDFP